MTILEIDYSVGGSKKEVLTGCCIPILIIININQNVILMNDYLTRDIEMED